MDQGLLENLQALEAEEESRSSRATSIVVVASVTALAVGLWLGRSPRAAVVDDARPDALAQLAAKTRAETPAKKPAPERTGSVSFPGKLSDAVRPTTALAAVQGPATKVAPTPIDDWTAPPATDRLQVVPLPARDVLDPSPAVARPSDALERHAGAAARGATQATAGSADGYQLQVSSFTVADEAHAFAERLRERGHRAFVVAFTHPERGTFYRVRVGPFPTAKLATEYRARFEAQEHMAPYLVLPEGKPSH
jgi:cell division septation protein DedD